MENCKGSLASIISFIEKIAPLYMEYLTKRKFGEKLKGSHVLFNTIILLLIAFILAATSWAVVMWLISLYLQSFNFTLTRVLLLILALNIFLLFITLVSIARIKKKIADLGL